MAASLSPSGWALRRCELTRVLEPIHIAPEPGVCNLPCDFDARSRGSDSLDALFAQRIERAQSVEHRLVEPGERMPARARPHEHVMVVDVRWKHHRQHPTQTCL